MSLRQKILIAGVLLMLARRLILLVFFCQTLFTADVSRSETYFASVLLQDTLHSQYPSLGDVFCWCSSAKQSPQLVSLAWRRILPEFFRQTKSTASVPRSETYFANVLLPNTLHSQCLSLRDVFCYCSSAKHSPQLMRSSFSMLLTTFLQLLTFYKVLRVPRSETYFASVLLRDPLHSQYPSLRDIFCQYSSAKQSPQLVSLARRRIWLVFFCKTISTASVPRSETYFASVLLPNNLNSQCPSHGDVFCYCSSAKHSPQLMRPPFLCSSPHSSSY